MGVGVHGAAPPLRGHRTGMLLLLRRRRRLLLLLLEVMRYGLLLLGIQR